MTTGTDPIFAEIQAKELQRIGTYRTNLIFYQGEQWQTARVRYEKQLTFNYAKLFIDKLTSYLMFGLSIALDPLDDTEASKKLVSLGELALDKVSIDNDLELLDYETELDAAILGDGCYKVTWDVTTKQVIITAPDVQGLYAWWMPDNLSKVYKIASKYQLPNKEEVLEVWTDNTFKYYVKQELRKQIPNPYGFIPFVVFPNVRQPKEFWGLSDVVDIKNTQVELNRALSQLSLILELSGNPIAVLENVEKAEDIAVQPGAVWELPENARAYLLDLLQSGGIRLHVDYIELLYRILHDTSESPKAAYGRTERDLSGVALEIELQPLLQKVRRKRLIRTSVYRRRAQMIFAMLKKYTGQDFESLTPRPAWGPVLPLDTTRLVENESRLVEKLLHSRTTAMDNLGIDDPDGELKRALGERGQILSQNREFTAKGQGRASESDSPSPKDVE